MKKLYRINVVTFVVQFFLKKPNNTIKQVMKKYRFHGKMNSCWCPTFVFSLRGTFTKSMGYGWAVARAVISSRGFSTAHHTGGGAVGARAVPTAQRHRSYFLFIFFFLKTWTKNAKVSVCDCFVCDCFGCCLFFSFSLFFLQVWLWRKKGFLLI